MTKIKGEVLKKLAFTLIELIIVIIVAGILAAVMIPSMERDTLREASKQIVRHIQLTQHLAMVDDVYDATKALPSWERALWTFKRYKSGSNYCYSVVSDTNLDSKYLDADAVNEAASDPAKSNLLLFSTASCTDSKKDERSKDLLLTDKYDVSKLTFTNCSTSTMVVFNSLGAPVKKHQSDTPLTNDCTIKVEVGSRTATITVEEQTGYTRITAIDPK